MVYIYRVKYQHHLGEVLRELQTPPDQAYINSLYRCVRKPVVDSLIFKHCSLCGPSLKFCGSRLKTLTPANDGFFECSDILWVVGLSWKFLLNAQCCSCVDQRVLTQSPLLRYKQWSLGYKLSFPEHTLGRYRTQGLSKITS